MVSEDEKDRLSAERARHEGFWMPNTPLIRQKYATLARDLAKGQKITRPMLLDMEGRFIKAYGKAMSTDYVTVMDKGGHKAFLCSNPAEMGKALNAVTGMSPMPTPSQEETKSAKTGPDASFWQQGDAKQWETPRGKLR